MKETKVCATCHRARTLDKYLGHGLAKDGKMQSCITCHRARLRRKRKHDESVKRHPSQLRQEVAPPQPISPEAELAGWWRTQAESEIDQTVAKAVEYGALDLIEIGRNLAHTQGRHELADSELAEMGVYFYLMGKTARWTAALAEGRRVSDDTLLDIGVYVRMAQRIRQSGGWPS